MSTDSGFCVIFLYATAQIRANSCVYPCFFQKINLLLNFGAQTKNQKAKTFFRSVLCFSDSAFSYYQQFSQPNACYFVQKHEKEGVRARAVIIYQTSPLFLHRTPHARHRCPLFFQSAAGCPAFSENAHKKAYPASCFFADMRGGWEFQ